MHLDDAWMDSKSIRGLLAKGWRRWRLIRLFAIAPPKIVNLDRGIAELAVNCPAAM